MAEYTEQKPHDLSDPKGIAIELAQEAVEDIKTTVEETAQSPGLVGDALRLPREKPIAALSIAAAVGFALGVLYAHSRFGAPSNHA